MFLIPFIHIIFNEYVAGLSKEETVQLCIQFIVNEMIDCVKSKTPINYTAIRREGTAKYAVAPPRNNEVLTAVPNEYKAVLGPILKTRPVRTASGVAIVAVMSKPHRCPHIAVTGGVCVYCAGGPDSDFEYSTQSYTGYEPTRYVCVCCCLIL